MGNPNHLISLLPPKVREAIQLELDAKVAEDLVEELFEKPRKEMEMTARTPKITRNECASLIDNLDRKSTRLNSSHPNISYAVFCLKKKKKKNSTRYEGIL